MTWQVDYQT